MKKRITIALDEEVIQKLHKIQAGAIVSTNTTISMSSLINDFVDKSISKKSTEQAKTIGLIIELALLDEFGKKTLQTIGDKLYAKHQAYFTSYSGHPEYLEQILREEFGTSSSTIIKKINEKIKERL